MFTINGIAHQKLMGSLYCQINGIQKSSSTINLRWSLTIKVLMVLLIEN